MGEIFDFHTADKIFVIGILAEKGPLIKVDGKLITYGNRLDYQEPGKGFQGSD